jgi:hypothetical protein
VREGTEFRSIERTRELDQLARRLLPRYVAMARKDKRSWIRAIALWALGQLALPTGDVLGCLRAALSDVDQECRAQAEKALQRLTATDARVGEARGRSSKRMQRMKREGPCR